MKLILLLLRTVKFVDKDTGSFNLLCEANFVATCGWDAFNVDVIVFQSSL